MTNIVQLNVPSPTPPADARHAALMSCFAGQRRIGDDVFWLKENAELLNVLECSGARVTQDALSAYEGFYANVERRIQFFPQYYRFLLSICLDLEDLGMRGTKGEALVHWAAEQGFAEGELSDLQRFEARRLMLRRGRDPLEHDTGLEARLRRFISRAATFSMPNKKAAYELTHAVFYLSEYGRHDPELDDGAKRALEFAGLLAFLEQNGDLLSEVCVAMRHAGMAPPNVWEDWLIRHTHRFTVEAGEHLGVHDDYHEFLVCNWFAALAGQEMFAKPVTPERMTFTRPGGVAGPLRELSECMFQLDDRSGDWAAMRPLVLDHLSDDAQVILSYAERSCDRFEDFFEGFARSHPVRVAQ